MLTTSLQRSHNQPTLCRGRLQRWQFTWMRVDCWFSMLTWGRWLSLMILLAVVHSWNLASRSEMFPHYPVLIKFQIFIIVNLRYKLLEKSLFFPQFQCTCFTYLITNSLHLLEKYKLPNKLIFHATVPKINCDCASYHIWFDFANRSMV